MSRKEKLTPLFDSWSSNMAYIFGFWWADGCIMANPPGKFNYCIDFSSVDKHHLEVIASQLDVTTPLRFNSGCYRLTFARKTLWNRIQELGGTPCKSLTAKWNEVPEEYLADFIRGYVDGDGCLSWDSGKLPLVQICGTQIFLNGMAQQIEKFTGIACMGIYQSGTKIPTLRYSGLKAKYLTKWLYQNSELKLDRKALIAESFQSWKPKESWHRRHQVVTTQMEVFFGEVV